MNIYEYKLDMTDDSNELVFDGYIKVAIPHWKERQKIQAEIQKIDEPIAKQHFMMELAEKSVIEVALVIKASGQEVKSFDDLMAYQEGFLAAIKISEIQLSGVALGKGLRPLLDSK